MSRVETTWMRSGALVLIATAWLAGPAVAAERSETLTLDASALEVENLVGSVQLRAAAGRDFVVEATIVAARTRSSSTALNFGPTRQAAGNGSGWHIRPMTTRYSCTSREGHSGRSQVKYMGKKVTVTSSSRRSAANLFVNLVVHVPADSSLKLDNLVGKISGDNIDADMRLDSASGQISIENSRGELNLDTGSGSIRVAEHRGRVSADTGSGSVEIDNVVGDVEADTGSGSVMLRAISGNVVADTGSGQVELEDILADRVVVDTGSGSVTAQRIRGAFEADTGSGSVRIRDFEAGEQIKVDTGSGRIELSGNMAAVRQLDLDTGSGGVDIQASEFPSMQLKVSAGSGGIEVQVPDMQMVRSGDGFLEATLGDGSGRGRIDTGSGRIRIRKL